MCALALRTSSSRAICARSCCSSPSMQECQPRTLPSIRLGSARAEAGLIFQSPSHRSTSSLVYDCPSVPPRLRGSMRATLATLIALTMCASAPAAQTKPSKTLDIYLSDTEGGKAALFVSPSGETVL